MTTNIDFLYQADKEILKQIDSIQLAKIISVDETNAMVQIEWVDKPGARMFVPISMPFVGGGWGIWTMPTGGESVVIGMRQNQFPIILAYLPYNSTLSTTFSTFFQQMVSDFNAEPISKGEIFLRSRIDYARCKACGKISTLENWAIVRVPYLGQSIDTCPLCGIPAIVGVDIRTGDPIVPPIINKIYLGSRAYFKDDGSIVINQEASLTSPIGEPGASLSMGKDGSVTLSDCNGNTFVINASGFTITTKSGTTITANELGNVSINAMTVNVGNNAAGGIITDLTHPVDFFTGTPMITRSSKTIKASS